MKKKTIIGATEQEIVIIIQEHISKSYDSIVAAEELGNQDWTVKVEMPNEFDEEDVAEVVSGKCWGQYKTRSILCVLCKMGHLEAGEYIIDCTW
jgi:hypothetical protein